MYHDQAFIAAFVKRGKRDRYREILSDPKLRRKFTGKLAHFNDFDPRYRLPFDGKKLFPENIARELLKRKSPSTIFAISEDPAIDQKELPLLDALHAVVGRGMGTVLSCVPGRLAFVETEDERYILERHDLPEKHQYIRFAIDLKDESSNVGLGIFQAAAEAVRQGYVRGSDEEDLWDVRMWFSDNLKKPSRYGRKTLPLGICWFKTNAAEQIARIWEMVRILERNGIYVKKIRTDRPSYLIYEDEWQIVAEPFRKGTLAR